MRLSPHYVLDEMTEYELTVLLDNSEMVYDKYSLELMRMNAFVTAKSAGAKVNKLSDMASFPWEDKKADKPMRQNDIQRMRQKAQTLKKYIEDE